MATEEKIQSVTDLADFNAKLEAAEKEGKLVLVDFYAEWCGPCHAIAPKVAEYAETYADKVVFIKVDVDKNERIAMEYRITAMPTFKLFKNSEAIGNPVLGANPPAIEALINSNL